MQVAEKMRECIVVAVDIETSGALAENNVIGVGVSVVDDDCVELAGRAWGCYFPHRTGKLQTARDLAHRQYHTVFEERCARDFWSTPGPAGALVDLAYTGPLGVLERHEQVIRALYAFIQVWEEWALHRGFEFEVVSDNPSFDIGLLNTWMRSYMGDTFPLPYSTLGEYSYRACLDTTSLKRGLLMAVDPAWDSNWGCTKRIAQLYMCPPTRGKAHNHNPQNDAYTIAYDRQVLRGIRRGTIARRAQPCAKRSASTLYCTLGTLVCGFAYAAFGFGARAQISAWVNAITFP